MDNPQAQTHDWEARYQEETVLPWDTGLTAPELEEFFEAIPVTLRPRHVLEIGCGTGTNAIWLARHGCSVVATEIAPTALKAAEAKAKREKLDIQFHLLDICENSPVEDGSRDLAFDRGVFHVIPTAMRPVFVERLAAALKPGGHWLCLAGNKDEDRPDANAGPPQLTAVQLLEHVEPHFEVESLSRSYFILPDGTSHLAWKAIYKRR